MNLPRTRTPEGVPRAWLEAHKNFPGQDCLFWPFWRSGKGYGRIRFDGKGTEVHRLMCTFQHGPPPAPKLDAAHSCGKGHLGCVNPQHLSWKTRKENKADEIIHGTIIRGERNGSTKLTRTDVLAIRAVKSMTQDAIAKQYGVNYRTIADIQHGRTWAWL